MSQLRQDPVTHDWVIINPDRAKRPEDTGAAETLCPFCPGNEHLTPEPVDCIEEDVLPTFDFLRQVGLKVAIVSNRSEPFHERVVELGLSQHVDLILAAGEVGWYKPDPRILQHAAGELGQDPERVMYIGDNFHADILGAGAAGMIPVLYDPRDLYSDADCVRIRAVGELRTWIESR